MDDFFRKRRVVDKGGTRSVFHDVFNGAPHVDIYAVKTHHGNFCGRLFVIFRFHSPHLRYKRTLGTGKFQPVDDGFSAPGVHTFDVDKFGKTHVGPGAGVYNLPEHDIGDVLHGGQGKNGFFDGLPDMHRRIIPYPCGDYELRLY